MEDDPKISGDSPPGPVSASWQPREVAMTVLKK